MLRAAGCCLPTVALSLLMAPGLVAGPRQVPARLAQARYVALAYDMGDSMLSESEALARPARVLPEDREALNSVRNLIEKWGRYVITIGPAQADLLVAVRAGRRASASAAVRIGGRHGASAPSGSVGSGASYRAEVSSADDMLSVYEASGGSRSVVLWRGQRTAGLSGASPTLLEDFKADVERAAKHA